MNSGKLAPSILSIKASRLFWYVDGMRNEANRKYTPNRSKEFDHLPFLSVWDLADTQEEVKFTEDDLPVETVVNSKGVPILIILPENHSADMGINIFDALTPEQYSKVTTPAE